jgi:hypothetical protein
MVSSPNTMSVLSDKRIVCSLRSRNNNGAPCRAHGLYARCAREIIMEREKGFEPSTPGLGSRCSATELLPLDLSVDDDAANMAKPMGFEPTISGVTGRHVNRYTTAPHFRIA